MSKKVIKPIKVIIINGRPHKISRDTLSYRELVLICFFKDTRETAASVFSNPNRLFTITYSKAIKPSSGAMADGDEIKIISGTIFNVSATDKA